MGGNERADDVANDETVIVDVMGGSDLDLRAASFPRGEASVTAIAVMGGATIWVPEGARVEVSGFALMGGNSNHVPKAAARSGPLIRVKAWSLMGGVDVRSGSRRRERSRGLPPPPRL
jgi:predicted membrane protein